MRLIPNISIRVLFGWRFVLILATCLIIILLMVGYAGQSNNITLFEQERADSQKIQSIYLQNEIEQYFRQIQSIATLVSILGGKPSKSTDISSHLKQAFDDHISVLDLDIGLISASFYDEQSHLHFKWTTQSLDHNEAKWVNTVAKTEHPQYDVSCSLICKIYVAIPVMANNKFAGVLVVAKPLSEIVHRFKILTGSDLVILRKPVQSQLGQQGFFLPGWNRSVESASLGVRDQVLLKTISSNISYDLLVNDGALVEVGTSSMDVQTLSYNNRSSTPTDEFTLISVTDRTQRVSQLHQSLIRIFQIGIVAITTLVAILLFLSLTFNKKWHRLAKGIISISTEDNKHMPDFNASNYSFDVLSKKVESDAVFVRDQEALIHSKNDEIASLNMLLTSKEELLMSIRNIAQVVILTLDKHQTVLSVNRYGEQVFGRQASELIGNSFLSLDDGSAETADVKSNLSSLSLGNYDNFTHSGFTIKNKEGTSLFSWRHAKLLDGSLNNQAVILSIGICSNNLTC